MRVVKMIRKANSGMPKSKKYKLIGCQITWDKSEKAPYYVRRNGKWINVFDESDTKEEL